MRFDNHFFDTFSVKIILLPEHELLGKSFRGYRSVLTFLTHLSVIPSKIPCKSKSFQGLLLTEGLCIDFPRWNISTAFISYWLKVRFVLWSTIWKNLDKVSYVMYIYFFHQSQLVCFYNFIFLTNIAYKTDRALLEPINSLLKYVNKERKKLALKALLQNENSNVWWKQYTIDIFWWIWAFYSIFQFGCSRNQSLQNWSARQQPSPLSNSRNKVHLAGNVLLGYQVVHRNTNKKTAGLHS